ncbi:HAD family hydrolase [Enterococcus sp. LJL51]|uniref:HAD family hydrolase n=1 Tax=Enterococcus sp. LJL51 TaxID=3416656 RepID=UPI003CF07E60
MIKNIVFDVGNVLVRYKPKEFIRKFTDNTSHQNLLLNAIFHSPEWIKYDRGTITKAALKEAACLKLPAILQTTAVEMIEDWYKEIKPIAEMEQVLLKLKEKGYQLYILSNTSLAFYQFKDKIPGLDYFDGIFLSAEWHMIKPEAEIYKTFCSHFQLVPAHCFFIDDMPLNIEAAMNMGMNGTVFRGDIEELLQHFNEAEITI